MGPHLLGATQARTEPSGLPTAPVVAPSPGWHLQWSWSWLPEWEGEADPVLRAGGGGGSGPSRSLLTAVLGALTPAGVGGPGLTPDGRNLGAPSNRLSCRVRGTLSTLGEARLPVVTRTGRPGSGPFCSGLGRSVAADPGSGPHISVPRFPLMADGPGSYCQRC